MKFFLACLCYPPHIDIRPLTSRASEWSFLSSSNSSKPQAGQNVNLADWMKIKTIKFITIIMGLGNVVSVC